MKIKSIFYILLYFSLLSCKQNNIKKSTYPAEKASTDSTISIDSTDKKVTADTSSPFDTTQTIRDYNSDGYIDTLASYYSGGSGSGGRYCTLIDGKTKDKYELSTDGCFCQIKRTVLIPPSLRKKENKDFRKTIANEILPERRNEPDPSLQWIIHGTLHHSDLSNNKFFNRIIRTPPNWKQGKISLPEVYYIKIKGDTLAQLYQESEFVPDWYRTIDYNEGWLLYYGHNHYRNPSGDSLIFADRSMDYEVFRTSHGVILKKENLHAWVFVSDLELTGAPQKLRWESIGKIKIVDKYIILQQKLPPSGDSQIFIINTEDGSCGRTKFRTDKKTEFSVTQKNIRFRIDGQNKSFSLPEIFSELK